jgi:hypothetical protein
MVCINCLGAIHRKNVAVIPPTGTDHLLLDYKDPCTCKQGVNTHNEFILVDFVTGRWYCRDYKFINADRSFKHTKL